MSEYENSLNTVANEAGEMADALTAYEKTVLIFSLTVIFLLFIIGVWSGILLFLGDVEGGGPLGSLMRILPLSLLF